MAPVTVFVGPNNSGKSLVLRELAEFCKTGVVSAAHKILSTLTFKPFDAGEAEAFIKAVELEPATDQIIAPGKIHVGKRGQRMELDRDTLKQTLDRPNDNLRNFCHWCLSYNTLMLDGVSRINHVNDQPGGNLHQPGTTSFQVLFRDQAKRLEVRRIIKDAFDQIFCLDFTQQPGTLKLKLATQPPASEIEEFGLLSPAAIQYFKAAIPLQNASDGVKAFTGMVTEVIAGDPAVVLIDEPEAFLHPALAFKLGVELSKAALAQDKRLFVSTHSAQFVMGCVQSGAQVNIIRLTYRDGVATARTLPSGKLAQLMRNPHLRSMGVLSALFYEFVIVTEADTDRAFYQEVNERLNALKPEWGIPNCLFINAQNKQGVKTILKPLRELGIPAVGLVDIDFVKDGGVVFSDWMESVHIPKVTAESLANTRANLKKLFEATGQEMKRKGGINLLGQQDKEAAVNFFDQLEEYGIFVVREGEIESWLRNLGATGHGPHWLTGIFQSMGDDPDNPAYVKPATDDVWLFMSQIQKWMKNPSRKGIPV